MSGAAVREQLRAVGLAVRREAAALAALIAVPTLVTLFYAWRVGESLSFDSVGDVAALGVMVGAAALAAPMAVWKGEERFGTSSLWLLPVDHRRAALAKVGAGWVWMMVAAAAALLWILLVTILGGGTMGADVTLRLLDPSDPTGVRSVAWTTPWWQWTAVFTGATAAYLLGSALLLATRHPWRWVGGVLFTLVLVALLADIMDWQEGLLERVVELVGFGRYGVDTVLSGGVENLQIRHELPSGDRIVAWRELPTFGRWAAATLLWTGLGLAAVIGAASRHREGRGISFRAPGWVRARPGRTESS